MSSKEPTSAEMQKLLEQLGSQVDGCEHVDDLIELEAQDTQAILAYIRTLEKELSDCNEVHADKQRLVRELDVALYGEKKAAKQASLCDLIHPALNLRKWAEEWASDICMALEHANCGIDGAREPKDALRHVIAALPSTETLLRVLKYLPPPNND